MPSLRPAALLAAFLAPLAPTVSAQDVQLDLLGTYQTGLFDEGAAEIVAYDAATARLFFVNAGANEVVALDASSPSDLQEAFTIGLGAFGAGANAVAVKGGIVAVAVEAEEATDNGRVVFFTTKGALIGSVEVGALPDNLQFSPDGRYVVVANEGEPSGYEADSVDPVGSVSIIDLQNGIAGASVATAGFEAFNAGGSRAAETAVARGQGLRIFGPGASVAQDLEPEYVAISPDGLTAYVSLQENNGLALVDLATARVDALVGLGFKDHTAEGLDPSDRDDLVAIRPVPTLGMYQPDAIAAYAVNGQTYVVTANEGDAREYDGFEEESRVRDLVLDAAVFPDAAALQANDNLGRLTVTTTLGDAGADGDFEALYSFGARSFSIHAADGTRLFDSGDDFEQITAARLGADFNSDNDENGTGDSRSDAKGPEPEAIAVGEVDGRFYAFIGLERVGGVMVYDVTDPANARFVDYVTNRDFSVDAQLADGSTNPAVGDLGPEGMAFIPAADSPTGQAMLAVSNEVSGTVSLYGVGPRRAFAFSLRLLHNNDGESAVLPDTLDGFGIAGGIARFASAVDQQRAASDADATLMLSSGDNFLASSTVNASQADGVNYDAVGLDLVGYDALALGNHDFDFGPAFLADFIETFGDEADPAPPFLSANLVFAGEPRLAALEAQGRIAARTVVGEGDARVGIIGATTPSLPFISSPGNVQVLQNVAQEVQIEVDALLAQGVNKIILISHLQGLDADLALIPMLSGVDVVVAGGGDELLANADTPLLPGDVRSSLGDYPLEVADEDGRAVPVVTTNGQYRYLGRLDVGFDEQGNVAAFEGDPIRIAEADGLAPDAAIQAAVEAPVAAYVAGLAATVLATTEVTLTGLRDSVRTRETNLGSLLGDAYLYVADSLNESFGAPDPQVAFSNGGGIRNDVVVPAGGAFTALDAAEAFPFGNFLTIVEGLTPERFKLLLEVAYRRLPASSGSFAQVAGFTVEVDTSRQGLTFVDGSSPLEVDQQGQRIRRITLDDGTRIVDNYAPVGGAPAVNAATIDFLAQNGSDPVFGGDSYPLRDLAFTRLGVLYQQAVVDYLVERTRRPDHGGGLSRRRHRPHPPHRQRRRRGAGCRRARAFRRPRRLPQPDGRRRHDPVRSAHRLRGRGARFRRDGPPRGGAHAGRPRRLQPAPRPPRRRPRAGPLRLPAARREQRDGSAGGYGQADRAPLIPASQGLLHGAPGLPGPNPDRDTENTDAGFRI